MASLSKKMLEFGLKKPKELQLGLVYRVALVSEELKKNLRV